MRKSGVETPHTQWAQFALMRIATKSRCFISWSCCDNTLSLPSLCVCLPQSQEGYTPVLFACENQDWLEMEKKVFSVSTFLQATKENDNY
jgi:hypothetical protein